MTGKNSSSSNTNNDGSSRDDAANLVRQRIDQLHDQHQGDLDKRAHHQASLLDRFWREHQHNPDQESAWHHFYSTLTDQEKHQLWHESQQKHATHTDNQPTETQTGQVDEEVGKRPKSAAEVKQNLINKSKQAAAKTKVSPNHFKPLLSAIIVVAVIFTLNYNDLVVAQVRQYITPGAGQNSPIIIDPNSEIAVDDEPRIIIPKINVDIPVVYNEKSYDEAAIQAALEDGVVHYGNTPVPGQAGNNVIVGHSSNNFFNSGKYKFAFVLLDRLEIDDTFILHYKGTRYIYKVYNKAVVQPDDFSVIQPTPTPTTTLITCTPPGTSWRRLVIQAEQISPAPSESQTNAKPKNIDINEAQIVPGNSPSLWQRLTNSIF